MNFKLYFFIFGLAILLTVPGFSQNNFRITIDIPANINPDRIQIQFDDGKQVNKVVESIKRGRIIVKGKFYSKYAAIMITFTRSEFLGYYNEFFVQSTPATITFLNTKDSLANPLEKAVLSNAWEISTSSEAKQMNAYTSNELNDLTNFLNKHETEINTNDSILYLYNTKLDVYTNKQLEYVSKNGNDYFAFWIFRTQLINALKRSNPSALLKIYDSVFPKKFTQTIEGKEVKNRLYAIAYTKKNYAAPNFESKDIEGKVISLEGYRGKYILLDFWASWCGPCIEKIPFVNKVRETYSDDQLEIIGISSDRDSSAFNSAVKRLQMKWTHIFGDDNMIQAFGGMPIPSLYLIDKKGIVIYSSWEDNEEYMVSVLSEIFGRKP